MKFLPYEHLKIRTKLSTKEACEKLDGVVEPLNYVIVPPNGVIEPKRFFGWFEVNQKPYEGNLEGSHFEVSRVIHYRNSFLPIIKGEIQPEMSGSSIDITMRPNGFVIAFMMLWLGFVGFFLLAIVGSLISSALQGNLEDPSIVLAPGGMFVFGYTLFVGGFKFESSRSKEFFRELFQAEEVEEIGIANPFRAAG